MASRSVHIASDQVEVELLPELGARIHRIRAFGQDLLRTPDDPEAYGREPFVWGCFVMAPWCNRLATHPTPVADALVELSSNFDDGSAIHGQVYALPWEATTEDTFGVMGGGHGWPWRYAVELRIRVAGSVLRLDHALTNRSDSAMPAGIGIHPWFRQPLQVAIPADRVFPSNEASRPEPDAVSGAFDLRWLGPMPPGLDATWVTPTDRPVELHWPSLHVAALVRVVPAGGYLCAASPGTLDAVAIEPQTHAPHGLRRLLGREPGALELLAPGETLHHNVEMAFSRSA